jgi:hypothetical protein
MASINKVILKELEQPQQGADHEHGPPLISLPSTRYVDGLLSTLTKHQGALGLLIAFVAVLAVLVMAFKR